MGTAWSDPSGSVSVSYNSPDYLAHRHGLGADLAERLRPIEALASAALLPE